MTGSINEALVDLASSEHPGRHQRSGRVSKEQASIGDFVRSPVSKDSNEQYRDPHQSLVNKRGCSGRRSCMCTFVFLPYASDLALFKLVYVFLNIAGADQRQDDLFSTESLLAKGRSALKGLKVSLQQYLRQFCLSWFNQGS